MVLEADLVVSQLKMKSFSQEQQLWISRFIGCGWKLVAISAQNALIIGYQFFPVLAFHAKNLHHLSKRSRPRSASISKGRETLEILGPRR